MPGSSRRRGDQRQGDGAVEQVGAARLAGPLGRPGDVEDVVEQLEGEADLWPKDDLALGFSRRHAQRRRHRRAAPQIGRGIRAGRRTRRASPSSAGSAPGSAARQIAMSKASPRWASSPRASATEASASSSIARTSPASREQREGAREEQVTGGNCARRDPRWRRRSDGRAAAAPVEDIIVDQGRHVDQLDRGRRADRRLRTAVQARAEQDQQRAQALAAGRESRRCVLAERSPWPPLSSRSRSSTSPSARGSQRLEASRTAVTGGGTAEAGSLADAAVDRDDPAGEHRVADPLEARPPSIFSARAARVGEAARPTREGRRRPRARRRACRAGERSGRTTASRRSRAAAAAAG